MKLAAKIMLVFFTVVMLLTAVGSYFSVRRAFERFEERQQQIARETAAAVEQQLAQAWRTGGSDGLLAAIQSLAIEDPRHQAQWVWFEQTEVTAGRSRGRIVEQRAGIASGTLSRTFTDERGQRHLRTYYPIDLGGSPRGGLEITGSLEPLDAVARDTIIAALVTLGTMALISIGLVYIAGVRWVARPLSRLIAKTERIGSGDFGDPLPVSGHDELSQLARALNDMSVKLAEQQQRIHDESTERLATLEQLRHADRLKTVGRLAAGIAHELGTPLNVVSGRAGLIASGKLSTAEVAASAHTIKSEADRIARIIRQLLDFARPSKSQRERVDVGRLLDETIGLLQPLAEKQQVRFESRHAAGLSVSANRSQLQQVFTNIVVNAIQSMPGGGTVTTLLEGRDARPPGDGSASAGRYVVATVSDQGSGISPENREHIFEPFFTTKAIGEGTGLGLSIAYGIVQEHGGWIDVAGETGPGSSFAVYLPQE